MADEIPGWARATIDAMNDEPVRARALLLRAGWPEIGDTFVAEPAGSCSSCGHPRVDVTEEAKGEVPVSLVTSGCLMCDVFEEVDLDEVDLVEPENIPVSDGSSADEDNGDAR